MKVEIFSDIVCPWCYIGERRFMRALAEFPGGSDVEIVLRPYQLDPTAPERPIPLREYLSARYGPGMSRMTEAVSAAGAEDDLEFAWDDALAVNTMTAHRLLRLAAIEGGISVQRALLERLFEAHFSRGEDVSDHETLVAHAAAVGMSADRVRAYLASGEGEAELRAELEEARALGVRSVPTFVFDEEYAVSGAQPVHVFRQVLEEVRRRRMAGIAGSA